MNAASDTPVIMVAAKLDLRDNQPFWRRKIFNIPRSGFLAWLFKDRSKSERHFPWIIGGSPDPGRGKGMFGLSRGSVDEVLFNITDTLVIGTANGSELVEVAYQHFTFVSGPGGVCDKALGRANGQKIADSLSSTLKGYIDPTVGVRVDCMVNPDLPANQINMYLGQGIFVPRTGENPIGWIRYYKDPSDREDYSEPELLDGRPAGLYKGQGRLVIGTADGLFPAEVDLGSTDETRAAYMFVNKDAKQGLTSQPGRSNGIDAHLSFCHGRGNEPVPSRVESTDEQCDLAWRIDFVATSQVPGRLELCVDSRKSRLHWKPNKNCNSAISTLLIDLRDFSSGHIDRLWIDLDHDNILIGYALQVARVSLVWDYRDDDLYVYEWGQTGSPFKKPGSVGLKCRKIENDIIEIGRADGAPFGYLELPEVPEKVIFSDAFQSFDGYHLDWLDECGRISFGDTILSLGEAYSDKCSGMPISRFEPGETRKVVGPLVLVPYTGEDVS